MKRYEGENAEKEKERWGLSIKLISRYSHSSSFVRAVQSADTTQVYLTRALANRKDLIVRNIRRKEVWEER